MNQCLKQPKMGGKTAEAGITSSLMAGLRSEFVGATNTIHIPPERTDDSLLIAVHEMPRNANHTDRPGAMKSVF